MQKQQILDQKRRFLWVIIGVFVGTVWAPIYFLVTSPALLPWKPIFGIAAFMSFMPWTGLALSHCFYPPNNFDAERWVHGERFDAVFFTTMIAVCNLAPVVAWLTIVHFR